MPTLLSPARRTAPPAGASRAPARPWPAAAWFGLAVLGWLLPAWALAQATPEAEVKAAYVFNFVKFVEWPPETFPQATDRIVIAVAGSSAVGRALEALDGREAQGRVVSVRHVSHPDEVRGAHVLFVSQSHPDIPAAVKWAERMPILTVTESDAVRPGSIINLVRVGSRIGFDVDLDAAGVARLRVSSRLLSVARAIQKRTAHGSH